MAEDYYATLGVSRSATKEDIKKAYRKLAHKYHPDKKGGDEEKFKEVNNAYQVLSDNKKKTQYDQFGQTFEGGGQPGGPFGGFDGENINVNFEDLGGFGDVFEQFFGGSRARGGTRTRRGEDVAIDVTISFLESADNLKKEVSHRIYETCSHCHGNLAEPGTPIKDCDRCGGKGTITQSRQTMFGVFAQQAICPVCAGEGKKVETVCKVCRGEGRELKSRTLVLDIPAGIADGQTIRISGKGEAPLKGGVPGDLYARVHVQQHPSMRREHDNVRSTVSIGFIEAALGTNVTIDTLHGKKDIDIPAGTQPNHDIRLSDEGFPSLRGYKKGDHIITVQVQIPRKLNKKQRQLLEELKKAEKKSMFGL